MIVFIIKTSTIFSSKRICGRIPKIPVLKKSGRQIFWALVKNCKGNTREKSYHTQVLKILWTILKNLEGVAI